MYLVLHSANNLKKRNDVKALKFNLRDYSYNEIFFISIEQIIPKKEFLITCSHFDVSVKKFPDIKTFFINFFQKINAFEKEDILHLV